MKNFHQIQLGTGLGRSGGGGGGSRVTNELFVGPGRCRYVFVMEIWAWWSISIIQRNDKFKK